MLRRMRTYNEEAPLVVTLWGRQWTREELLARVGRLEQLAGIRLVEGGDGAERGVRMLRCWSGAGFDFEVLVDRGFDIGGAWINGRPLAWSSPVGLVGPWYCEPAGIGWFRGFPGGLVSTCGLDHTLLGGADDTTVFNYPHRVTETYGLHGRYTGLPARLAGYGVSWDGDDGVLWAEGEVLQAALFGEQLLLRRRIEADLGGVSLRITDTVTNIGPTPCPHMMLYHCNIGFPVVDAGSELVYPSGPGTCVSAASSPDYLELTGPSADFVEECYEHDMRAGPDGLVGAAVVNRAIGLGVFQRYERSALPRHITWRQLGTVAYVVAMEPSTNRDAGRFDARQRGELAHLGPGEARRYRLEIGALVGDDAIDAFARAARDLAGQVEAPA
jgi:Domain of unknown function (DUF4432)